ncbi:hypothetical protein Tco_0435734 [Tanacetum coccineum]
MASATCEVIWITNMLNDLCITNLLPVNLYSDSNSAIQIAANPVFHEITKHFEVDVHLVREKVQDGVINTIKVASADQTADLFTKGHGTTQYLNAISLYLEGPLLSLSGSCVWAHGLLADAGFISLGLHLLSVRWKL